MYGDLVLLPKQPAIAWSIKWEKVLTKAPMMFIVNEFMRFAFGTILYIGDWFASQLHAKCVGMLTPRNSILMDILWVNGSHSLKASYVITRTLKGIKGLVIEVALKARLK